MKLGYNMGYRFLFCFMFILSCETVTVNNEVYTENGLNFVELDKLVPLHNLGNNSNTPIGKTIHWTISGINKSDNSSGYIDKWYNLKLIQDIDLKYDVVVVKQKGAESVSFSVELLVTEDKIDNLKVMRLDEFKAAYLGKDKDIKIGFKFSYNSGFLSDRDSYYTHTAQYTLKDLNLNLKIR